MLCPSSAIDEDVLEQKSVLSDDFTEDRAVGAVVGSRSSSGHPRLGVDIEGVISIDHGALRIAPLIEAGFGRAIVSYGPFQASPGLCFAVRILNGHNTAQAEPLPDTFRERIACWLKGSGTDSRWTRLRGLLSSGRVRRTLRQFQWWRRTAQGADIPALNENLVVGWFSKEVVQDPRLEGASFTMYALGPENGELRIGTPKHQTRALRGVQNLPLYLMTVLRPGGAIYYVASLEGARGTGAYPLVRPIGVDRDSKFGDVYLGIHQSVIGQIGFRIDTRLKGVRVAQIKGYDTWFGGATAADTLIGDGTLDDSDADIGGQWQRISGRARRSTLGAVSTERNTIAALETRVPVGMIHASVKHSGMIEGSVGIVCRLRDARNFWKIQFDGNRCEAVCVRNGEASVLQSKECQFGTKGENRIQVLDDGTQITAYLDGIPVANCPAQDDLENEMSRVGFMLDDATGKTSIHNFEAHARSVLLPEVLDMGRPWARQGTRLLLEDGFEGQQGDLQGRTNSSGKHHWTRTIGTGAIEVSGANSARVCGSVQKPCPSRTVYTVDWAHPDFADLEVTITPSGTDRGGKHHCSAGLIIYQDNDNYVICNFWLSDAYAGGSVSTFFKFDGFEDLYDAVWTNIGDRISHGRPTRLRLCSDGTQYIVYLDDEPVLYRAFRDVCPDFGRIAIKRVGLVANWEWGFDTGSVFQEFKARI